ncbi:MAG: glycosyltransferase family 9 protein [Actinobacteria bacterium]|nr:glycosyltransferase family 9 protein [Actinomycetota bacterium]
MARLNIYDRRERMLVGAADRALQAAAAVVRPLRRRHPPAAPGRILLVRLERIGDLLMTLAAIGDVRRLVPEAEIDLVVGTWNAALAKTIRGVTRVRTLDAAWLAREEGGLGLASLARAARAWRADHYDLAINFEPDIRSNLLVAMSGARWTAGYRSGGGGALLDLALDYDNSAHTTDNARRLVARALGAPESRSAPPAAPIVIPEAARAEAARRIAGARGPLVGLHASGGRAVKQWDVDRFAEVARRLVAERGATIVLTGSAGDRPLVDRLKRELPADRAIDVSGALDLVELAALVAELDLLVTGDTGPMHIAAAMATPIVAVFGPSDPARYGPRGPLDRIVRVDLPCSPCNRIRLPPARCIGHTPDCLALVGVDSVFAAAVSVLDAAESGRASGARA